LGENYKYKKHLKITLAFIFIFVISFMYIGCIFFPDALKHIFEYLLIALKYFIIFIIATVLPAWHGSIPARIANNEKLGDIESPLSLLTGGAITVFIYFLLSWISSFATKSYSKKPSFFCVQSYVLITISIVFLVSFGTKYFWFIVLFWSYYVLIFVLTIFFWENLSKKK